MCLLFFQQEDEQDAMGVPCQGVPCKGAKCILGGCKD